MGTSTSNKGTQGTGTPIIPSWQNSNVGFEHANEISGTGNLIPNEVFEEEPFVQQEDLESNRYRDARTEFTRFVRSKGTDTDSLKRALSKYVSRTSNGAKGASRKMGASRKTAANLLKFLTSVQTKGFEQALKLFNLGELVGESLQDIFIQLSDYICPEGGTVDIGIARDAFMKTIADITSQGVTDLENLSLERLTMIMEIYLTHTIEEKIYNEIGTKGIALPQDENIAENLDDQIRDFIKGQVIDSLSTSKDSIQNLQQKDVLKFIDNIYEQTFQILQNLGEKGTD